MLVVYFKVAYGRISWYVSNYFYKASSSSRGCNIWRANGEGNLLLKTTHVSSLNNITTMLPKIIGNITRIKDLSW